MSSALRNPNRLVKNVANLSVQEAHSLQFVQWLLAVPGWKPQLGLLRPERGRCKAVDHFGRFACHRDAMQKDLESDFIRAALNLALGAYLGPFQRLIHFCGEEEVLDARGVYF